MDNTNRGRVCIICDTPYQLLNSINFAYHQNEFDDRKIDIMICNRDIPEDQIKTVISTGLFNKVYVYNTDLESARQKRNIAYRASRFCFPRRFIASYMVNSEFNCRDYEHLICAFPMPITVAFTMVNPDVRIRLIDDGIGTYISGIPDPDTKKRRAVFRLKGKTSPWSRIEAVYVNNRDFFKEEGYGKVIALTPIHESSDEFRGIIDRVFGYDGCEYYKDNKGVYLTQPLNTKLIDESRFWETERSIINAISDVGIPFVIRKHPKQETYIDHGFPEDLTNDLWEIVCEREIGDENVLVGCYSTAQFSPKFLYNREPWVVFTLNLYDYLFSEEAMEEMNTMISKLKDSYDSERIIVVGCIDDLKNALIRIKREM